MKKAPIPQNEKERLRALRSHRIDYAEIDFAFDQITKIAAQMMGVSTSLISFIEEDTNFIKSGHGTDASSVPREISVCGHTLVEKEVMILDNIPGDERFHDNPILVGDNPVNFYIGKAIIDKNGFAIGTLCAFGEEKIQPTSDQINAFESLANHIIHLVELNKKKNEASELHLQSMQIQKIAKTGGWELDVASGKTEWTEEVYKIHKVDFGTPTDKIQGIEFYAESERPKLVNYIQRCVEFAERFDDEFEFYDSEGEKKWVRSIGEPVLNSKGKVEKLVGVFQDLTELKNVIEIGETATKELEKFFDVGLDFLCIANQEGYFTKINPAFSKTLGYSDEVILSTPIVDFVHPDDIQATLAEFESLGQGHQTISFQNRYKHRDGHFIYLDWKASPDNETGKIYAAARNVTEQVHEKQLKAAISEIRKSYISYKDKPSTFFDFILSKILELTESEYGFIGEIKESSEGKPFLKTYSITNIAWNDETKKFYEQNAPDGMEFTNLETLFGHTLRTGGPIITNSPMNHPASGGLPKGHPDLNAYMGIPIYSNNRMIAMAGIANRSLGYSSEYFDFLQPLISVLGETIKAYQLEFELRKTEDLNAHYKMALDKAAIVAFTDTKGNITYANELFCKVSGYDIDELIGQNHRLLKSGVTSDETFKDLWKTISSGEIWEGEICNRKKDGSLYWLDTVIVPYKNKKGKIEHYMAIRNDVTAFKQKQQELDQALVKAEAAAIAKSDFLSTMSHEIRTPLNGIIGMTSLLMDTELSGEQHEFVGSISTSGSALLMIVNDILDFSKIESGKIEFEKVQFNYRHLLEELVLPFEYEAKKKKLTFVNKVEYIDHALIGDSARIGQVINNLISNAIKFTDKGEVSIHSEVKFQKNNTSLEIKIKDTGVGIPEESQKDLFDAFTQADVSVNRKFGGTGLGLSICKRLVELMNGSISFESQQGVGTTFTIVLPLEKGDKLENQEKSMFKKKNDTQNLKSLSGRILIAEDNITNQLLISRFLEKIGCKYHAVGNGKEVLEELGKSSYDLILMDCQMPELDGYAATEIIRASEKGYGDIPIIALTANALKGDEEKCLSVGMNDYLSKPILLVSLHQMLSKYLSPKSDKPKEPTSAVSAIDKKVLSDLALALGEDGVNELVKIYIQTLDDHIQSISTHLKNGAMEDASRAAHTLKSSTLSLGGVVLGDLCQQIEQFTEDDQEKGLGVLPKLSNYADQFKEALFEIYPKLRVD